MEPAAPVAAAPAQTISGLQQQLRDLGLSDAAQHPVRRAWVLAERLFAGRLQASGRPFLSHLVGVASVLARLGCDPSLVASGLLHSVYRNADFGDRAKGPAPANRRRVAEAVGHEVETRLFRIHETRRAYAELRRRVGELDALELDAALIQLADELEKLASGNVLRDPNLEQRRARLRRKGDEMVALARALGFPSLAAELASSLAAVQASDRAPTDGPS